MVVFTPKGLLRLEDAASKLTDLTDGRFQCVIDDPRAGDRKDEVKRLVLCSGKVYYDIDGHDRRAERRERRDRADRAALPVRARADRRADRQLPEPEEIVWAQEEPQNMGAWKSMSRRLPELIPEGVEFRYVGRPERASPSRGLPGGAPLEQERIVLTALEG